MACAKVVEAGENRGPQMLRSLAPFHAGQIVAPLPEQNDLAARVRFGLEQHGVHPHVGDASGGERLKVLCAAHLAVSHDPGIVAHVLRLERRNSQSLP